MSWRWLAVATLALILVCSCKPAPTSGDRVAASPPTAAVPAEVVKAMQNAGLSNYQLIDKQEYKDQTMWLAIPQGWSAGAARPPGSDDLIVFKKDTKQVLVIRGK